MSKLLQTVERLERRAKERAAEQPKIAEVIQLPLWGDSKRGIPNEVVRSALFTVRNHKHKRDYFQDAAIAVLGSASITYRGEELRTDDEDVWLQLMHLVREQPLGEWVEFSAYSMLKALGWPVSGHYYKKLRTSLSRMQATAVTAHSKRLGEGVSVSLVRRFQWQDDEGKSRNKWRVWIEPEMKKLYGDRHYTQLEWERRRKLTPLAKRLYDYYASHAQPYPVKVQSLSDMSGTKTSALKRFRQLLRRALDELKAAELLEKWWITDKDLVFVVRTGRAKEMKNG